MGSPVALARMLGRLAVGGAFVFAGAIKAWEPEEFYAQVQSYRILPPLLSIGVAFYLPFLELICGACLLFEKRVRPAGAIIFGLCFVFAFALIQAWARGLDIECGCFGGKHAQDKPAYVWWIVRDLVLAFIALILSRFYSMSESENSRRSR